MALSARAPHGADHEGHLMEDKGPVILGLCWTFTVLSSLFVIGRIYVRGFILKKYMPDDYLAVASMVCGFIGTSFSTVAVANGNGRHTAVLSEDQQQSVILWTTVGFCPGIMSFSLPKLAVISLLTQLLEPSTIHKWILWSMGLLCQLLLLSTVGVLLGRCQPMQSLWDWSIEGTCYISHKVLVNYCIATAVFSAFLDIYLAVYPATVLWKLNLRLGQKLTLSGALGMGLIGAGVAIYKVTEIPNLSSPDFSYDSSDLVIWTVIEGSTLIIACSIPTLRPLAVIVFQHMSWGPTGAGRSSGSSAPRSTYGSRFDRTVRRKRTGDTFAMETLADENDNKGGPDLAPTASQELILNKRDTDSTGTGELVPPVRNENGTIVRTDSVVVAFEPHPPTHRSRVTSQPSFEAHLEGLGVSATRCKAGERPRSLGPFEK